MVAVVVVEGEVVLAGVAGICRRLAVALLELVLVDATVPQSEAAAKEVVRGVSLGSPTGRVPWRCRWER